MKDPKDMSFSIEDQLVNDANLLLMDAAYLSCGREKDLAVNALINALANSCIEYDISLSYAITELAAIKDLIERTEKNGEN